MGPSGALSSLPKLMASVGHWVDSVRSSPPMPLSPPPTSECGGNERIEEDSRLQEYIEEEIRQSIEHDDDGDARMTDSDRSTPPDSVLRTPESQHLRGGFPKNRRVSFGHYSTSARLAMVQEDLPIEMDMEAYDTSSDWDDYGTVPQVIDDYEEGVARLEGSEDWNADQRKVHKLIFLRGLHPMIPSNWRICFKMWGINQPHLDDVFTPTDSEKRVVIHAYKGIHAAGKALENLFYLSQYVTDYEELGLQRKASSLIVKAIRNYIKWSMMDASITPRKDLSVVLVHDYTAQIHNLPPSSSRGNSMEADPESSVDDSDEEQEREDGYDDHTAKIEIEYLMSRSIKKRLRALGKRWREVLMKNKTFVAEPPTLYQFSIIQHMVVLSSYDPSSPKNPIIILDQFPMNDRGQWLWNALSIAIPVHLARDAMIELLDVEGVTAEEGESDDPDV
ncbi:hypothetical protein QBC40DRAFT_74624 [Triangularia verruculosa]|uniref:Uncharacterized protein n=1 Tax=Triangularia verruculosa TaxID=2587418 RepID=A0AAN6XQ61_9PEZI|nr:hypothetical protein QBC40DRAFT_74624 [Triangularia verruculosa]